jgi:hypothetical protein
LFELESKWAVASELSYLAKVFTMMLQTVIDNYPDLRDTNDCWYVLIDRKQLICTVVLSW